MKYLSYVCFVFAACILLLKAAGLTWDWSFLILVEIGVVSAGFILFWLVRYMSYLPTEQEVGKVVADIHESHAQGYKSHKANLYFYFPPQWGTHKMGREGWVLHPKGLGSKVAFSIWAFDQDPEFSDTSFQGMILNLIDILKRQDATVVEQSFLQEKIAGKEAVGFVAADSKGNCMLGFFWCYGGGDYLFLVDYPNAKYLEVIRPAIAAFMLHFEMI